MSMHKALCSGYKGTGLIDPDAIYARKHEFLAGPATIGALCSGLSYSPPA